MSLKTFSQLRTQAQSLPSPSEQARRAAIKHQDSLMKPHGALGRLEEIAVFFASWQDTMKPQLHHPQMIVFASNHGIATRQVSAYPPNVTQQIIRNFRKGQTAINALCTLHDIPLKIVPLALTRPTRDFTTGMAMSETQCMEAIAAGMAAVPQACDVVMLGDIGVGNSTVATAVASALLRRSPHLLTDTGSGISKAQLQEKTQLIWRGLQTHKRLLDDPLDVLCALGGRELAACVGALFVARQRMIPIILDGLTPTAAALVLCMMDKNLVAHCLAGHRANDKTQRAALEKLMLRPLLDLEMRLGQGTGAAIAYGIVQAALRTHGEIAKSPQTRRTARK